MYLMHFILNAFAVSPINYRFPSTSPVKPLPSSCREKENLETFSRDKERLFKLPHLSRRTVKKHELLDSLVVTYVSYIIIVAIYLPYPLKRTKKTRSNHLLVALRVIFPSS